MLSHRVWWVLIPNSHRVWFQKRIDKFRKASKRNRKGRLPCQPHQQMDQQSSIISEYDVVAALLMMCKMSTFRLEPKYRNWILNRPGQKMCISPRGRKVRFLALCQKRHKRGLQGFSWRPEVNSSSLFVTSARNHTLPEWRTPFFSTECWKTLN